MHKVSAFVCAGLALLLSPLIAQTGAQPASPAKPTYDETLEYIQERLAEPLEERGHCKFIYHSKANVMFDASDLTRNVIWSRDTSVGEVSCQRGRQCVNGRFNSWRFTPRDGVDRQKIGRAVLHLLELCNAATATPEHF